MLPWLFGLSLCEYISSVQHGSSEKAHGKEASGSSDPQFKVLDI